MKIKRVITMIMAAAMIITSSPAYVYAEEAVEETETVDTMQSDEEQAENPTGGGEEEPGEYNVEPVEEDTKVMDATAEEADEDDTDMLMDESVPMDSSKYELKKFVDDEYKDMGTPPFIRVDDQYEGYTYDAIKHGRGKVKFTYTGGDINNITVQGSTEHFYITSKRTDTPNEIELTLEPRMNFGYGHYEDTVRISDANGKFVEFSAVFHVNRRYVKFRIVEAYKNVDLGYLLVGDEEGAALKEKEYTFVNDGNIKLSFDVSDQWDKMTITPSKFNLEGGASTKIKIRPKVDSPVSEGTATVQVNATPYQNNYGNVSETMTFDYAVGNYLSGEVSASSLANGEDYYITGDTTLSIAPSDNIHICKLESKVSGVSLTVKSSTEGNDSGCLTADKSIIADGHVTIKGGTIKAGGGIKSNRGDITVNGGNTVIGGTGFTYGLFSEKGSITVTKGNIDISGGNGGIFAQKDVTISGSPAVVIKNTTYGIGCTEGNLTIKGSSYVYSQGDSKSGAGLVSMNGEVIMEGTPVVRAMGAYAVYCLSPGGDVKLNDDIGKTPDANLFKSAVVYYSEDEGGSKPVTDIVFRKPGDGSISLNAKPGESFSFGENDYGENPPASVTAVISNTGSFTERIAKVEAPAGYDVGDIVGNLIAAGKTLNFKIGPKKKLAAGEYNGPLKITTEAGTTAMADLSFKVKAPTATISATPNKIDFGTLKEGYKPVTAQNVTIKNTGEIPVNLQGITLTNFTAKFDKTYIEPGQNATLTINPNNDLLKGDYSLKDLYVESNEGAFAKVDIGLKVEEWKYELTGESEEVHLGRMHTGYSTPVTRSYTLKNTGEKPLTITEWKSESDRLLIKEDIVGKTIAAGKTLKVTLAAAEGMGEGKYTTNLTVKAHGDEKDVSWKFYADYSVENYIEGKVAASELAEGTDYNAYGNTTITISPGDNVTVGQIRGDADITITGSSAGIFTADQLTADGSVYINGVSLKADVIQSTSGSVIISGDSSVDADAVYSANGDVTIGGSSIVSAYGKGSFPAGIIAIGNVNIMDSSYVIASGKDAAIIAYGGIDITGMRIWEPNAGVAGKYEETGYFSVLSGTSLAKDVRIGAESGASGTLTVRHDGLDFGTYTTDDYAPAARTVTLVNEGEVVLILNDPEETTGKFVASKPEKRILRPGEMTSFTIQPVEGLAAKYNGEGKLDPYVGTVTVSSDKTPAQTIEPLARVETVRYGLELKDKNGKKIEAGDTIDFGTFVTGYEGGMPHEITITNTGNIKLTMDEFAVGGGLPSGYRWSKLSKAELEPGENATFLLSVGNVYLPYDEADIEITVKGYSDKIKEDSSKWPKTTLKAKYKSVDPPKGENDNENVLWMVEIPDQTYTGSAIKPEPEVYFKKDQAHNR